MVLMWDAILSTATCVTAVSIARSLSTFNRYVFVYEAEYVRDAVTMSAIGFTVLGIIIGWNLNV